MFILNLNHIVLTHTPLMVAKNFIFSVAVFRLSKLIFAESIIV